MAWSDAAREAAAATRRAHAQQKGSKERNQVAKHLSAVHTLLNVARNSATSQVFRNAIARATVHDKAARDLRLKYGIPRRGK
jgi:hypothetical protein